ncbi:MAG: hypothetical protein AB8G15_11365 [Saprospiraceae bacterium]
MSTAQCKKNIENEPPPYNIECTGEFCVKTRPAREAHCTNSGQSPDTPVLTWDPALGKSCYCCCSCYTLNTPIAVANNEFALIQNLSKGDQVLTTGTDLVWRPGVVQSRSGDINPSMVEGLYLVAYRMDGEKENRKLIVTADHLFMLAKNKSLKKVQHLIPNDGLLAADGTMARVVFVAHGTYDTAIQSIEMEGIFDGKNLDGHLLNANGVVSTDFKVQTFYEAQEGGDNIWVANSGPETEIFSVGEPDYVAKFDSKELSDFLDNPEKWPKDFIPKRKQLVNIPVNANRFLTDAQAEEVAHKSVLNDISSSRDNIEKVMNIYTADYPEINFILDWHHRSINAYSWVSSSQQYVLITGKLARLKGLYTNGNALIIADVIARLIGSKCVAEGDYNAFNVMRLLWPNSILGTLAPESITEVEKSIFDKLKNKDGDAENVCEHPSIDCRIESMYAGLSFFQMPECGIPPSQVFNLKQAYANFELTTVEVIFSEKVQEATGGSTLNYNISNDITIKSAKVDGNKVALEVEGLEAGTNYVLDVSQVESVFGVVIQPNPAMVIIAIPIIDKD